MFLSVWSCELIQMCLCVWQQRAKGVLVAGCFWSRDQDAFLLKFIIMGRGRKGRCSEKFWERCRRLLE